MALQKCPRCELNYIKEEEKLCSVCRKEVKSGLGRDEAPEICIECGEREAAPGEDICLICLRARQRKNKVHTIGEQGDAEESIGLADVSEMDEIGIDLGEDIPDSELEEIDEELEQTDTGEGDDEDPAHVEDEDE